MRVNDRLQGVMEWMNVYRAIHICSACGVLCREPYMWGHFHERVSHSQCTVTGKMAHWNVIQVPRMALYVWNEKRV